MESIIVKGGTRLSGSVKIEGSKNAVLPVMTASLLAEKGVSTLNNVPLLSDVDNLSNLLKYLGADVNRSDGSVRVDATGKLDCNAPFDLVSKMRASMLVMGPMLARYGYCNVAMPGGCAIGSRPVEQHIKGLEKMGVTFRTVDGSFEGTADGRLQGAKVYLDFPSVGATQNLIMAASLAEGTTHLENVAREPEIEDLANYINAMGGNVKGAGTGHITIEGVESLQGTEHTVIPDRIEAGTFMIAGAITKSEIVLENVMTDHLTALISKLEETGVRIVPEDGKNVRVIPPEQLKAIQVKTMPHPGFPTDMQSQMMALLTTIDGVSIITETIFENRFMHVEEFSNMGADIDLQENHAIIKGVKKLQGGRVKATDLRAAAALILAGLAADGYTVVTELKHLDRGYVDFHKKLEKLGADIERTSDDTAQRSAVTQK
ncbi:UDP-N-acetylglucosamine 1-carboxyvinyltransferase [Salinicoccus halodurans]|uniref:UDP-N-acetylglucosamine 1-carboxyvinyltransferase n=1 Tax=Salinicoccus halodurans TaxID=407035 RepID=A0A0F7D4T3_9STAP|nr:UDP-N-acetylglucosamine 1-carboxyvinyltransferase [Salinicoccus halodurans]AKG74785.1 UDP-N-acetylglucosamine 1-carboxyvinyltransferase [Salinicoccus halodurans]SFK70333.1 UDP-N-acetylglucosamine 1-carboxyvinyltransferase [Salinicoccus halodurans]